MAFTQTVLSVIAGFADSVSGQDILLFCTVALLFILTALVLMFFKNPQLLIAQNADLIPLALLEKFDSWEDPKLVQHVLNAEDGCDFLHLFFDLRAGHALADQRIAEIAPDVHMWVERKHLKYKGNITL